MPSQIIEKKRKDGSLIYRLDRDRRKGEYHINPESSQLKFLEKIKLDGFRTFPRTLYPTGFGFKVSGTPLLKTLYYKYGSKLRVTLSASKQSSIIKSKTIVRVTINEPALVQVNRVVSEVKRERGSEITSLVNEFLGEQFPRQFKSLATGVLKYQPNTIADLLADQEVLNTLSEKDKNALKEIYPNLVEDMEFTLRSTKKMKFISDSIKTSQKVYIEKIIKEFESKLGGSSSESVWQKFLHSHILTLLNTYAFVIEKQSVQIDGKYPDFMLVDAYGYLDVYEIKKPQTRLLKYDRGRNNYYWDSELTRAIVQTEKYISNVQRNRYELETKFRKKRVKVQIVRPRGFIIAGRRADLKGEEIQEDFRVLNDSLKNIDVICFDDLLDNLRALFDRLTSEAK
jgi:hypothetical protein